MKVRSGSQTLPFLRQPISNARYSLYNILRTRLIYDKDAGCEESQYPVEDNNKKCWHFVKATRDYGFIEGAYDSTNGITIAFTTLITILNRG